MLESPKLTKKERLFLHSLPQVVFGCESKYSPVPREMLEKLQRARLIRIVIQPFEGGLPVADVTVTDAGCKAIWRDA